ncbi:MAG: MATE family efflux transporter [Gemmatimonadetes bacterium]|nr:MATE family efflux transporter [Gemmatimonadota bacterium]
MVTGEERAGRAAAGYWVGVVWDALRGRGGNPTQGRLGRAIVLLAVPMVLEMVMESLFAVVDIFFVSQLGSSAVAAVGLTESLLALIYTVAMGLGIGVTAMVARRVGEGNPEEAAVSTVQAVMLGAAISLLIGVFGALNAPRLLQLMGADAEVVRVGAPFAAIVLGGNAAVLLLFVLNAAFRGAGDAAIAMRVLWLANGINLVLDPLFIFGLGPFPELGVTGAAVATTTGRSVAVLLQLAVLLYGSGRLRVRARHLRLRVELMGRLLRLSGTGMFQVFVSTASWIALVRIISGFGSEALAGYTIAIRIVLFGLLPAWGLANAASTMVGQALGARDPDRAERAVWMAGRMNLYFLGSVGVLFMIAAVPIVSLFGGDPTTSAYAVQCLRIVSAGFFFYAYGMVLTQSFNGAGDTWTPTMLNLVCFWLFEIPLAWLLAHGLGLGPTGVFLSITLAFSSVAVLSGLLFRRGEWKLSVV